MDFINAQIVELKRLWKNKRQLTHQLFSLVLVVFSALMIWQSLIAYTKSESPVVVVLSGSMEPAFQRGDILFLSNTKESLDIGDIVVFKIDHREIPIVHRVMHKHTRFGAFVAPIMTNRYVYRKEDLYDFYLTKGDNNNVDDRGLYAPGQKWLERKHIVGLAEASIPYAGMITILLNDYPMLKYVLVGAMGLLVITQRE